MVQLDLVVLKNGLERLSVLIQGLSYANLDQVTKGEVQDMNSELKKIYDNIIKILRPFYDILNKEPGTFQSEFDKAFKNYKESDLKHANKFDYHCKIVTDKLRSIAKKKNRFIMLPSTKKLLAELNRKLDLWILRDDQVYDRINELDDMLNEGLSPISSAIKRGSKIKAQNELREFLLESKPSFEQIKVQRRTIANFG